MTQATFADPAALKDELVKIDSVVVTARRLLADGRMIDLTSLETKVRDACEAAMAMEKREPEVADAMERLIADLDDLAEDLRGAYGALDEAIGPQPTPSREAALRAYGTQPDQGGTSPDDGNGKP